MTNRHGRWISLPRPLPPGSRKGESKAAREAREASTRVAALVEGEEGRGSARVAALSYRSGVPERHPNSSGIKSGPGGSAELGSPGGQRETSPFYPQENTPVPARPGYLTPSQYLVGTESLQLATAVVRVEQAEQRASKTQHEVQGKLREVVVALREELGARAAREAELQQQLQVAQEGKLNALQQWDINLERFNEEDARADAAEDRAEAAETEVNILRYQMSFRDAAIKQGSEAIDAAEKRAEVAEAQVEELERARFLYEHEAVQEEMNSPSRIPHSFPGTSAFTPPTMWDKHSGEWEPYAVFYARRVELRRRLGLP